MHISLTDFDQVTKIVEEHFPSMEMQAEEVLGKTYSEFLVRANSKASYERTHFSKTKQSLDKDASEQDASLIQSSTIEDCEESLKILYKNMQPVSEYYTRQIGAIPEAKWKKFLESHLKENGNLYVPEQVLRIIEQLAVNNDINSA